MDGCVYTLDTAYEGYRLGVFANGEICWTVIPVENGYRSCLPEGWLYQVPTENVSGQLTINRMKLPLTASEVTDWAERIELPYSAEDYERWGRPRVQYCGERVLYETPEGALMLQDGQKLWDIPDDCDSIDFAPHYYWNVCGVVAVYEAQPQSVKTADWPK